MRSLIVLFLFLVRSLSTFSQDKLATASYSNVVKINLGSLAVKNFALQGERAVGKKISIALGIRLQPYGDLPFQQNVKDNINDPDIQVANIQIGNFAITPEFRYYFGKHALKGFYVAPYARYASFQMEAPVNYNSLLVQKTAYFKGHINSLSGGLLLGSQFNLGKRLVLDLWIIGGHFGSSNGNLRFAASLTPQEQDDIRQTLSEADIPLFNITYDINSNGGSIRSKGAWVGFRGLALNLGFRF